jgi:hypothetical protein
MQRVLDDGHRAAFDAADPKGSPCPVSTRSFRLRTYWAHRYLHAPKDS